MNVRRFRRSGGNDAFVSTSTFPLLIPPFDLAMFGECGVAKIAAGKGKMKSDWASNEMRFQRDELDQSLHEQTDHRCTDKATNILPHLFGMVI
ncbi:hypothetical protein BLNAU_21851 [Blattamonas nauphoetae]|uniref:Uncharacterized protein n=1 Tax=Blattamonas nauphoetae TaxID=2049346 RepID=A0ABQ9WYY9_9EUKA|nr:hypothetical protein BLNAU_21851 [Blattamonas nauphoetae]